MTTKPITFDALSVRAMLDGHKTQHRWPMEPQPEMRSGAWYWRGGKALLQSGFGADYVHSDEWALKRAAEIACIYQPGDLLWVKEPFYMFGNPDMGTGRRTPMYQADRRGLPERYGTCLADDMPQWASRLSLRVESVRVERLQEMSFYGVQREYAPTWQELEKMRASFTGANYQREYCEARWNEEHPDHPWDTNPWVWVMTFEVIKSNVDAVMRGEGV